jgi:zinc protease
MSVLGISGGFSGRLMSTVREKEGLTYGIYAYLESATKDESGYMRLMTFFSPKDIIKGLTSTFREITTLYKEGITKTELNHFKTILHTRHQLIFDSLQNTTQYQHQLLLKGFDIESDYIYMEKLLSVTQTSVHTAIINHLNPASFAFSMAGPTKAVKSDVEAFCAHLQKTHM